jgi:hypothetical protein
MFSDIKNLREYNYKTLEWKANKFFGDNEYYLICKDIDFNDNHLFSILRADNDKYSLATAESINNKWKFINKSEYILTKDDVDIAIHCLPKYDNKVHWQGGVIHENDEYVARYFKDILEFKNGIKFQKRNDITMGVLYGWSFIDMDTYEPIIKFKKRYRYKSIASVKIDKPSFDRSELLLLMMLGCQIVIMDYHILEDYAG